MASSCCKTVSARPWKTRLRASPARYIDYLANLVVSKVIGNSSSSFPPMAELLQQEILQGFIQGGESVLRCELGDLAELLKGEVMAEDRPCCQELEAVEALRRRSLIERGQLRGSFTLQSVVLEYATARLICGRWGGRSQAPACGCSQGIPTG